MHQDRKIYTVLHNQKEVYVKQAEVEVWLAID
ncbi:hypothetical protein VCR4J5_1510280 [Vibrio crassostreae]|uniref:Uncharacterized protein n=1 Tax=Vibrio crassostreae TaxID=246167 RepID=A0ABM9QQ41_9VIBR|nr:hypothetical protein VCR4J5_1510280 [Vibrio crassostreae]